MASQLRCNVDGLTFVQVVEVVTDTIHYNTTEDAGSLVLLQLHQKATGHTGHTTIPFTVPPVVVEDTSNKPAPDQILNPAPGSGEVPSTSQTALTQLTKQVTILYNTMLDQSEQIADLHSQIAAMKNNNPLAEVVGDAGADIDV